MYLLNHYISRQEFEEFKNLHSTMYLLNLSAMINACTSTIIFTFHYVSIKSLRCIPTLYRLLRFTFHYVSIKSGENRDMEVIYI